MWVSSLKANPDGDYPGFIAVVWSTLHTEMGEAHDADLIVGDRLSNAETNYDINEAKRGSETHERVNKNSGVSSCNKRQKVKSKSKGTPRTANVNSSKDSTNAERSDDADGPNVVPRRRGASPRGSRGAGRGQGTPPRGSRGAGRRMSPRGGTRNRAAI